MSPSFPGVGENSTLSSAGLGSQSGHGGGRGINTDASCLSHGGGGETGFCDRSAIKDGSSSNAHVADRGASL